MEANNPKEVKETLNRLMDLGYDKHESIHKIGVVLVGEIYKAQIDEKPFNTNRYIKRLKKIK